jgi:hypothetical protein
MFDEEASLLIQEETKDAILYAVPPRSEAEVSGEQVVEESSIVELVAMEDSGHGTHTYAVVIPDEVENVHRVSITCV